MTNQPALPTMDVEALEIQDETHAHEQALFEQMLGDLPWAALYRELMIQKGWSWRKAAYIAWSALPAGERLPKTLGELANMLGLSSAKTIAKWRQGNPAIDLQVAQISMAYLANHAPAIVEALVISASDPGYKHAPDRRVALQMLGLFKEQSSIGLHTDKGDSPVDGASYEELAELAGLPAGDGSNDS